ncbi:MAG: VOC family protein [Cytophagaceae bacterium]|nr:VOC family protein [Gemmatimonadaceae bacterium]
MNERRPKVYPCLAYRDPAAAIAFLQRAFGFSPLLTVPGEDGVIMHAELSLGDEVIMLGVAKPDLGWVSPLDLPALNATVCFFVDEVDAHYERAVAAGATVVRALRDTNYGSREYSVKDPEGQEWHFGTYRPAPGAKGA